jgi:hypothetical protein
VDPLNSEALQGLRAALSSLLPAVSPPDLPLRVAVLPRRITPTGLGGFVGLNAQPAGEIYGRRVVADVSVAVRTTEAPRLDTGAGQVAADLVGTGRSVTGPGLLELTLADTLDDVTSVEDDVDVFTRRLVFAAVYEHLHLPTADEAVIGSVPLDVDVTLTDRPMIRAIPLGPDFGSSFEIVDDPAATVDGPSQWAFDVPHGRLEQRSAIRAPGPATAAPTGGTMLLLRRPPSNDLTLRAELASGGTGAIGVVFRYQDSGNYAYAALSRGPDLRMIGRKSAGTFTGFAGGQVDTTGYDPGRTTRLAIAVRGTGVTLTVDGQPVLSGTDPGLPASGRIGLYAAGNTQASFTDLALTEV